MTILKESWKSLINPSSIEVREGYNNITRSVITMEPFTRGFAHTLGNSLRRMLLSSINGFAVTSIKIDGVLHEYSAIDGVKEDVLEIIMNLKSLALTNHDSSSFTLKINSDKPGPIFAGSIETTAGVEIVNKDLLICTLNEGGKISMQIVVESGRGYRPAEKNKKDENTIGNISIDAIFSPVRSVAFKVENARVGQITDYDKLIFDIETDGSISPQDAMGVAAKILQEQLNVFITFDVEKYDEPIESSSSEDSSFNRNLLKTIDELELSVRSYNCLKNENIIYVGDLVIRSEGEMLKTANFGRKSLNELKENLSSMNLSFGMKLNDWPPKNIDELLKVKNKDF